MKNLSLALLFLLFSCDEFSERYLYSKYDPEYEESRRFLLQKCVDESSFFSRMTTYADFSQADYRVGDTYLITRTDEDDNELEVFAQITAINAADMVVKFNSVDDDYDSVVTFTEAEYASFQTDLETAACDALADQFSFSGLGSATSIMTRKGETVEVEDSDDDGVDEEYYKSTNVLKFNTALPIFFYLYNGTKTLTYDQDEDEGDNEEQTKKYTYKIVEIDEDDDVCDDSASCDFSHTLPACNLELDTASVDNEEFQDVDDSGNYFLEFDSVSCKFF